MARYIGDQNAIGFFFESGTYANTSGALQWIGQVQDFTPDENLNIVAVRHQGSADRNVDQFVDGPIDFTGTFSFFPQDWKFLMFALGSNVDAGSPSPFTHTISEVDSNDGNAFTSGTDNPMMSFGLEASQTASAAGENFVRTIKGAIVNALTINAAQGEIISVDIDYMAQENTFSSGARSALTETTTRPFLWSDVSVQLPSGTPIPDVKSTTVSITNNLEGPHYQNGSKEISVPIPLNRDYQVSLTLDGTSEFTKTLYDQHFLGGSLFNMIIDITDAGAGAGSRDVAITFSGCRLIDMEAPQGMEGVNEQTITIQPENAVVLVNDTIEEYNPF